MAARGWRSAKSPGAAAVATKAYVGGSEVGEGRGRALLGRPVSGTPIAVVWHKWSDLRLLDHEPLVRAHAGPGPVLHIHLVELSLLAGLSRVARVPRCSPRRAAFWREAVSDLAQRLEARGQRLMVCAVAKPAAFFTGLCDRLPVAAVYAHSEFCDEELKTEVSPVPVALNSGRGR